MQEPKKFEGYWTLAGSDASIPGSLTFTPEDGVVLALNGTFDTGDPFRLDRSHYTIHGVTPANKQVTLVRCLHRKSVLSPGYSVSEYTSPVMIIGCHFSSYEDMKFRRLSISYDGQAQVFGASGIADEYDVGVPNAEVRISYKKPEPLTAVLGDFTIETRYSWGVDGDGWDQRRIAQRAWLTALSDSSRHLDDFLRGPFGSLQTLMELAADSALPMEAIVGLADAENEEHDVEVYLQPAGYVSSKKEQRSLELLFTFYGLGGKFAETVQKWHMAREKYGPTFDLFFSLGRSSLFLEHQFLSLIQAIEAYHRRAFPNYTLPPEEHTARVERVLDALSRDERLTGPERRWVELKIQYNEPSLAERLEGIYERMPPKAQGALGSQGRFVHTIADTRHYMTHWDKEKRARALVGRDLFLGIQQLRLVMKAIFLGELGLATDAVIDRLQEPRIIAMLISDRT